MKLTTVAEMRQIDKRAIEEIGIPEIVLMENAAREIYSALSSLLQGVANKRICIIAGVGNNGGDAFAAARHIVNGGGRPKVFVLGSQDRMSQSAAVNFNVICNMGIQVFQLQEQRDWDKLMAVLKTADGVLDGLLGTGFHGQLRENSAKLINIVNNAGVPILSIDVPSGVNAENGQVDSVAIQADATLTLGEPKWGMLFAPGSVHCGHLLTDGIGIPSKLLNDSHIQQELLQEQDVKQWLVPRATDCHKGSCGRILVVAGSRGMTGAASLASLAALRMGAGIVTLACPASLNDILEVKLTEVMTLPLEDKGCGYLTLDNLAELLQKSADYDLLLIGPGLGRQATTGELVRALVTKVKKPVVLDADGIYAFREQGDLLANCSYPPVLTPHMGEMATLLGITVPELKEELLELARDAAKEYKAIMVIKSETTIVVYPDGMAYVANTGNPGMATAGCGDVLAGTIAGLYRQTVQDKSPLAGVYIHGRAGDLAYGTLGNCLLAHDIIDKLPEVAKELTK